MHHSVEASHRVIQAFANVIPEISQKHWTALIVSTANVQQITMVVPIFALLQMGHAAATLATL